jgi:hypothetical protein
MNEHLSSQALSKPEDQPLKPKDKKDPAGKPRPSLKPKDPAIGQNSQNTSSNKIEISKDEISETNKQQKPLKSPRDEVKLKDPVLVKPIPIPLLSNNKVSPFNSEKPGSQISQFPTNFNVIPVTQAGQQVVVSNGQSQGQNLSNQPSISAQQLQGLSKADKEKIEQAKALAEDLSSKLANMPGELADIRSKAR